MSERKYIDFKQLKSRVSMRDIIDHYGLTEQMERKNENTLVGPCPITGSSSETAFKINESKDVWYSFALEGDGDGGNILDFVVRIEDVDIVEAANMIDEWFPDDEEEPDTQESSDVDREEAAEEDSPDIHDTFATLCEDEIGLLEDGARNDIADALEDVDQVDTDAREEVADRLTRWVLRAYKSGYKLGKMQGQIDERVAQLD